MAETNRRKWIIMTVVGVFAVYFGSIWFRPLYAPGEVRYGQMAREMLLSGDFTTPTLNGLPCMETAKGALGLMAWSMKFLGETAFAVRFPGALFTLLTAGLLLWAGKILFTQRTAWMGALIFSGFLGGYSSYVFVDPQVPGLALTAAFLLFNLLFAVEKKWLYLVAGSVFLCLGTYLSGGTFFWTGLVPLLYFLWQKQYKALPGALTAALAGFLTARIWGTLPAAGLEVRYLPGYPLGLAAGTLPMLLPLLSACPVLRKKGLIFFQQEKTLLFLLFSLAGLFICSLFSPGNLRGYLWLSYPLSALLFARCFEEGIQNNGMVGAGKIIYILSFLIGGFALLFIISQYLPFLPGKYKFFSGAGLVPVAVSVGLVLLWYNMAAKEKNCFPERKFLYFCVGTGVLMLALPHLIPFKIARHYEKSTLIRHALRNRLRPDARLYADRAMAPVAAWTLKKQVNILETAPLKNEKTAVTWETLGKQITRSPKNQQFVIFTQSAVPRGKIPARQTVIRSGKTAIIIYGDVMP